MKKKFLGIKLSTVFTVLICLLAAVLLWLYVKFSDESDMGSLLGGGFASFLNLFACL